MTKIYETHHLSRDKESLVYNFFDSETEAQAFFEAHKNSDKIAGAMSVHTRDWCKSMLPPEGTKSYWHGDFGNRVYSKFNQL